MNKHRQQTGTRINIFNETGSFPFISQSSQDSHEMEAISASCLVPFISSVAWQQANEENLIKFECLQGGNSYVIG